MERITVFLEKTAALPVLIGACIVFLSFPLYVLPRHKAQTEDHSRDAGYVDLSFFPSTSRIFSIAEAYGEQGRRAAVRGWLTIDIIWPLVYSFFFLVCINASFGYVHGRKRAAAGLAAVLPLLLDYCENTAGIVVMGMYPEKAEAAAFAMSAANGLKWISFALVVCLFLYGIAAVPVRFFLGRRAR